MRECLICKGGILDNKKICESILCKTEYDFYMRNDINEDQYEESRLKERHERMGLKK